MWSIPRDKQQGKPLGSSTLGPLHNIEGTVKANRDIIDFSKGLCVIVRDFAVAATENDPIAEEDEEEDQVAPVA
ncbi:hypothetical protein GGH94_002791 [Coemansia aciculifera]|uniref:Uncharacterized protein n=2 Tax=Coemansia TaxID=4863 RepID=A0A9W8H3U5_9FUNG|nr:hypothetical protein GGI19_001272 [Coemansia pectinata]KAJ2864645.1 hypothetical protein GGH94_002791 [Coemansia aciculifera]